MRIKYWIKNHIIKNKKSLIMILILVVVALTGYTSYAIFSSNIEHNNALNIVTGNLYSLIESEDLVNNSIVLEPNSKKEITIKLTNGNSIDAKFNLYYLSDDELVKVYYKGNSTPIESGLVIPKYGSGEYSITYTLVLENKTNTTQSITIKSDSGLTNDDLVYPSGAKVLEEYVGASGDPNDTSGASIPTGMDDLIPVVYDDFGNTLKAGNGNWYNYDENKWANAVLVNADVKDTYMNAEAGYTIDPNDINSYYVWIPRYEESGGTINYVTNEELAHLAFTKDSKELEGFWVSKYMLSDATNENIYQYEDNKLLYSLPNRNTTLYVLGETNYTGVSSYNSQLMQMNASNILGMSGNNHINGITEVEYEAVLRLVQLTNVAYDYYYDAYPLSTSVSPIGITNKYGVYGFVTENQYSTPNGSVIGVNNENSEVNVEFLNNKILYYGNNTQFVLGDLDGGLGDFNNSPIFANIAFIYSNIEIVFIDEIAVDVWEVLNQNESVVIVQLLAYANDPDHDEVIYTLQQSNIYDNYYNCSIMDDTGEINCAMSLENGVPRIYNAESIVDGIEITATDVKGAFDKKTVSFPLTATALRGHRSVITPS